MAISAQGMNDFCMPKLIEYAQGDYKNEIDHPKNMKVLAKAMQKYLEDNLSAEYSWVATRPSDGQPDPVTKYTATVKFDEFDFGLPGTLNPGLSGKIMECVATGKWKAPAGFSLSDGSFTIKTLTLPYGTSFDTAMMDCIFIPVCAWIVTCMPGATMSGSHAAYVGSGTMVKME